MTRVDAFSARLLAGPAEIERRFQSEIAAAWAEALAEKPRMFDGRVLLAERAEIRSGVLEVDFREVGFSTLIWLRTQAGDPPPLLNVFGAAAVLSADGTVLLGRMAAHTANAGQVYFPCGTPDFADVVDGRVDLDGSTLRELAEETGLGAADASPTGERLVVRDGALVACVRPLRSHLDAQGLSALVGRFIAGEADSELEGVEFVRSSREAAGRCPAFVKSVVEALIG